MTKTIQNFSKEGLITKNEAKILRSISIKPVSKLRQKSFNSWKCSNCEKEFYYSIIKCPICEGRKIEKKTKKTKFSVYLEENIT